MFIFLDLGLKDANGVSVTNGRYPGDRRTLSAGTLPGAGGAYPCVWDTGGRSPVAVASGTLKERTSQDERGTARPSRR